MIKYIILIAAIAISVPFWLPTSLGGDTSYHFVLSDSMKGTLDPGAFVVLRRSDSYQVGDAVGYHLETGNGERVTILHRIISLMPDGRYLLKGDAVESTEEVDPAAVTGRMVFAVPALGFLPGAFRQAPLILGGLMLATFLFSGGLKQARSKKDPKPGRGKSKEHLFLPATLVILLTIPFASVAMADMVPIGFEGMIGAMLANVPLFAFLLGVVAVTRIGEVVWVSPKGSAATGLVDINYAVAMVLAVTVVPFTDVIDSVSSVMTL